MNKITTTIIATLVIATAAATVVGFTVQQPAMAQESNHGDVVSGATSQIIGPMVPAAQNQINPGAVSDPAQDVGDEISVVAQPKKIIIEP